MAIYYIFTAASVFAHQLTPMYPVFAITLLLNIITQILLLALGRANPGILPKIFPKF
jgi:palmitoyltransferase ZDHHC9/14/18